MRTGLAMPGGGSGDGTRQRRGCWIAASLGILLVACSGDDVGAADAALPDAALPDAATGPDADPGWDPRFDGFVDALKLDLAESGAYGVSAAVMEDGEIVFARAFGSKDIDGTIPLTPHSLMQIGSTTKQMTATALLQKVEDGSVALDDTLEELLPQLEFALDDQWDDQITLHDLVSHQGGIVDYVPWDGSADDSELADFTYGPFAEQAYLMNPPGLFWNYSNPNFVFAGLVTETFDDRPWPEIMYEDVFASLGMDRSFLRRAEVEEDGDYADSYGLGLDDLTSGVTGPVTIDQMPDPGAARPAGLLWTTPTQMMAWADFIMHGNPDVLSGALRDEIVAEQVDTRYLDTYYGYGMMVHRGFFDSDDNYFETPVWEHGGNTLSFSHFFYMLPEHDFAVAICASGFQVDFSRSVEAALTTLDLGTPVDDPPDYTFDPERLPDHAGTYTDPYNVGDMIITYEPAGPSLGIEMPTLTGLGFNVGSTLTAVSSDIFIVVIDGQALDLTFIPTEPGGLSQYVRNRAFVTSRVAPGVRAATARRPVLAREHVLRTLRAARLDPMRRRLLRWRR